MTTVLVVDDSLLDQNLAGTCVAQHECTALFADNGLEALKVIKQDEPDIVLTDLQMPEMDGLELVRVIRNKHSSLPVILMTGVGSEEIAVQALRAGAAGYVPKKKLRETLGDALQVVKSTLEAYKQREQVRLYLDESESRFKIGYEPGGCAALISYFQDAMRWLNFCDESELMQICLALTEAFRNAIDHGNLELDSRLREAGDHSYRDLGDQRANMPPYNARNVYVTAKLTRDRAVYTVRDEGPGFDPTQLPDPTDPENLLKNSGRGVMLITTFMDEVTFNDRGNEITMVKFRRQKED